jgi:hypothetical protein
MRGNVQFEYRKRRADGEYRWMLCSGVPRFGPDGECVGYIGTCSDITDLKRSRDEDTARQKLETVGKLAGGSPTISTTFWVACWRRRSWG